MRDVFGAGRFAARWRAFMQARRVPLTLRLRLLVYAACPALLAPFFALKRLATRDP